MTHALSTLLGPVLLVGACARPAVSTAPTELGAFVLPDDPATELPVDGRVHVGRLPNGLTYYIEPNRRPEGRVELRLVVKAGSILEEEHERGVAHFVEHMAFNGSEHFEGNEVVGFLESVGMRFGSDLNAYTSFDETVYELRLPTDDPQTLSTGFLVLHDWATGVTFDPAECDKEKGVVIEEWRLGEGLARRVQDASLPLSLYGSRYLDRLPIGSPEIIANLDCEAARAFYERWYRPDLMALMVVGDIDVEGVERVIKRGFSDLQAPRGAPKHPWYTIPDHAQLLVGVFADAELPQGGLMVLDKVDDVQENTHGAYRSFLLEQLLFLMLNERLAIASQDPEVPWLAAMANTSPLGHEREAQGLQVVPKAGRELAALEGALVELERLERFGFTPGELQRAKAQLADFMQQYYDERDTTDSDTHIGELLRVFLTNEPMPGIPYEYALAQAYLPALSLEEANAWADAHLFTGRSRVIQAVLPDHPGALVPTPEQIRAISARVPDLPIAPPEADEEGDAPLLERLPTPGTARRVAEDADLGTTTWELSNGIRVILKPTDYVQDEIVMEAVSPGGLSLVADADYVPAVTASSILFKSGLGELDAIDVAKRMAGRRASISPGLTPTHEILSGEASTRDLETMLQLLYLAVTAPRFDARGFELERQQRAEALENRAASPDAVFEERWNSLVWNGNPRMGSWDEADLAALDRARSEAVYRDRFGDLGDLTMVLAGSLDEATVVPLLERYVATLPSSGRVETWQDDGTRRIDGRHEEELLRGETPRARARILFHGPFESTWESRLLLTAVATVLETRLLEDLREERGGTYGVTVDETSAFAPQGRYGLQIDFECDPERLDELLAATWEIVEDTRTRPFASAGVAAMREKNRRSRETAQRTNGFWAASIAGAVARGEDPRDLLAADVRDEGLTPTAIRDAAARWLDTSRVIQAVQRP